MWFASCRAAVNAEVECSVATIKIRDDELKLHTNVTEGTSGIIFKKKIWKMTSRVELSPEEEAKVKAHPEIASRPMVAGMFLGTYNMECSVGMLLNGMTDSFDTLASQIAFEQGLREGCGNLKTHFGRLTVVQSGPNSVEF